MEKKTNKAKLEIFKFLRKSAESHIKPLRIEDCKAVDIMWVKGSLNTHNATS